MERILVTGAAGYIGSILVRQLLQRGYHVRGLDSLRFGGDALLGIYNDPHFEFIKGDIRDQEALRLAAENVDAVVHLAAIVGDPACRKEETLATGVNWSATRWFYDYCHQETSIERFVFASTCSNYGKMAGDGVVDENSPLQPVSHYARLKVQFEEYLLASDTRKNFIPTSLRFATVYGLSPRMRFDLTVNEFVRDLTAGRELEIFGEQFWRPYGHVRDLARSCVLVLESEAQKVDHDVFGVGDSSENYQKRMLADEIRKVIPDAKIKYVHRDEDPRDYRVDFSKIRDVLGFEISSRVPDGIREVHDVVRLSIISEPFSKRYQNT